MSEIKRIGIDPSKAVFTLHAIDQADRPVLRVNLRRTQMLAFFKKRPRTEVALEACGSAHHWARKLMDHPYSGWKTEFADGIAISSRCQLRPTVPRRRRRRASAKAGVSLASHSRTAS